MFDHRGAFARVSCVVALCLACLTSSVASVRDAGAPGGVVFTLAVAFAFSIESSRLARLLPPTPTLTTQMCAGVLLRNIPGVRTAVGAIDGDAATTVRALALGLILSRAGLASDADAWRRVMSTFAQGALAAGSPLRTLYSQFAGDAPAARKSKTKSPKRERASKSPRRKS